MQRDKLLRFIRGELLRASPKVCSFVLVHKLTGPGGTSTASVLETYVPNPDADFEATAVEFTSAIEMAALTDIEAHTRVQQYGVVARGENEAHTIAQYSFRLSPPTEIIDKGETEPPTPSGALAQSMRLTESFARMVLQSQAQIMAMTQSQAGKLLERNAALEKQVDEYRAALSEVVDSRHELHLETIQALKKEERKDRLLGRVEQFVLPAVLEKFTGQEPFKKLLSTLSEDQFNALMAVMSPDQIAIIKQLATRGEVFDNMREGKFPERVNGESTVEAEQIVNSIVSTTKTASS